MSKKLGTVPLVRRIEYLETYLFGVKEGYSKAELEELLIKKKEELETEKSIAVGRGQLTRARTSGAVYLLRYCYRLSRDLGLINQTEELDELLANIFNGMLTKGQLVKQAGGHDSRGTEGKKCKLGKVWQAWQAWQGLASLASLASLPSLPFLTNLEMFDN